MQIQWRCPALTAIALAMGLLVGSAIGHGPAQAGEEPAAALGDADRATIESVIRDYLLNNPEIIIEALEGLEERQRLAAEARQREALAEARDSLENSEHAPVMGNPDGDVTLVEFFDYQCGYCKQVAEPLRRVVEEDGQVRLVMIEFPILGPGSLIAARAALAAHRQGGYEDFHWALMDHRGQFDEDQVLRIAERTGLNVAKLRRDMGDAVIEEKIRQNHEMAERLAIRGTPAFIVGDRLVPGALPAEQLRGLIDEARRNLGEG